jgi:hypothetical protein
MKRDMGGFNIKITDFVPDAAGVEFIPKNGGGAGVRLSKP